MQDSFIIANRTDVGRARQINEDSMVTFDSPNGRVVAVCDGMGGQAAGDVASRLACDIITDILTNNTFSTPGEAITRACMAANQGIIHRAAQNPELEGMGATCVMVIIKDGLVYYGWIGDSRIYYINNGSITQLSHDQSYVQQLVDSGKISAAEAENHPQKNEILNALGLPTMTPPVLCTQPLNPAPGSVILLCSDGLSGMVDNQSIASVVSQKNLSLQQRANQLVDRANANGGVDNITVQLVQFGAPMVAPPKPVKKSNGMLWGAVAAAAIILIIAIFCFFLLNSKSGDDDKKTGGNTPAPTEISKPSSSSGSSHTTTQPKTQSKSSNTGKSSSKGNTGKNSKNFKEQTGAKKANDSKKGGQIINEPGEQEQSPKEQHQENEIKDAFKQK